MGINLKAIASYSEKCGVKSILQTKPLSLSILDKGLKPILETSVSATPFKSEAESLANYGQAIVKKKPISEEEYYSLKDIISDYCCDLQAKIFKTIDDDINPFNEGNIESVKAKILEFLDNTDCDPDYKQNLIKMLQNRFCGSKHVLSMFKEESINTALLKERSRKLNKYAESNNLSIESSLKNPAEGFERIYSETIFDAFKKKIKLIQSLTPKSTKPEVLKLEQEVANLGVKEVNFANDIETGTVIKEAIEGMIKAKSPLPLSITVTPLLSRSNFGECLPVSNENCYHIFLSNSVEKKAYEKLQQETIMLIKTSEDFKKASVEVQQRLIKEIEYEYEHYFSTKNPKHIIFHEARHGVQKRNVKSVNRELSDDELEVAKSLSGYAAEEANGQEFTSEAYAKLMSGEKLTPEQMKLYMTFDDGIFPAF